MRVRWVEAPVPEHLVVTQVYGFCFDWQGRTLLIGENGRFNLPGGKPEGTESYEETLRREVIEEAQVTLGPLAYLGHQIVEDDPGPFGRAPYAQVRMIAQSRDVRPTAPDPATGRTYQRLWCPRAQAAECLQWGTLGHEQVAAACVLADRLWGFDMGAG